MGGQQYQGWRFVEELGLLVDAQTLARTGFGHGHYHTAIECLALHVFCLPTLNLLMSGQVYNYLIELT